MNAMRDRNHLNKLEAEIINKGACLGAKYIFSMTMPNHMHAVNISKEKVVKVGW